MTGYESKKAAAQDKYRAVKTYHEGKPVYVAQPAQRTWVGLTEADLKPICDKWRIVYGAWVDDFARAIEAKLKGKNSE